MRTTLQSIGNSQGVIIPKPLLGQAALTKDVEMSVERGAIVLRKPKAAVRAGWADDSKRLADAGDDGLVWPEFANDDDLELVW